MSAGDDNPNLKLIRFPGPPPASDNAIWPKLYLLAIRLDMLREDLIRTSDAIKPLLSHIADAFFSAARRSQVITRAQRVWQEAGPHARLARFRAYGRRITVSGTNLGRLSIRVSNP